MEVTFQMKALCCVLAQEWLDATWVMNSWKSWMPSDTLCECDVKLSGSDFCMDYLNVKLQSSFGSLSYFFSEAYVGN